MSKIGLITKSLMSDEEINEYEKQQEIDRINNVYQVHQNKKYEKIKENNTNYHFNDCFEDLSNKDLCKKIDNFILWFNKNIFQDNSNTLKTVIKKIAFWYEIKYNNDIIDKLNNKENLIVNKKLDYNLFYDNLTNKEKFYLDIKPQFEYILFSDIDSIGHLSVNNYGIISENDYSEARIYTETGCSINIKNEFIGMNLIQAAQLLNEYGCIETANNCYEMINNYQIKLEYNQRLFDCVMYQIISNSLDKYGIERALLFAKEFNKRTIIPDFYHQKLNKKKVKKLIP